MVYDHHAADPNPVRDPREADLREADRRRRADRDPRRGGCKALPDPHLLPYLVIDWTGLRLGAIEGAKVADLDEHRQALLARASIAKNRKPQWVALHDVLFEAIVAQLPPREDRDLGAPMFPGFKGANLRTAITRACRLTGTPGFSPHERKRRGSLLGKQGYSLAEIAERLGDTKTVTAEHYLFAIGDYAEADYAAVLSRLREDVGLDNLASGRCAESVSDHPAAQGGRRLDLVAGVDEDLEQPDRRLVPDHGLPRRRLGRIAL